MNDPARSTSLGRLLLLSIGELASMFGRELSFFALGVWVYRQTHSITAYGLMAVAWELPFVALSFLGGALTDRFAARRMLVLCGALGALTATGLVISFGQEAPSLWPVYLAGTVFSVMKTGSGPAKLAAVAAVTAPNHFRQALGLFQLCQGAAQLSAPLLCAALLGLYGIRPLLALDALAYVLAIIPALFLRIAPRPDKATGRLTFHELLEGQRVLLGTRGLRAGLVLYLAVSLVQGFLWVLIQPMVLKTGTVAQVGQLVALSGAGFLAGGLFVVSGFGLRRNEVALISASLLMGLGAILAGATSRFELLLVGSATVAFAVPVATAAVQALCRLHVEASVLGRACAFIMAAGALGNVAGYVGAGPLVDLLFEPSLLEGGALTHSVGQVLGVGPGRGIGLFVVMLGATLVALSAGLFLAGAFKKLKPKADALRPAAVADATSRSL